MRALGVSERRACRVLGQARSTQRRRVRVRGDEDAVTKRVVQLASCYGRYGYRRITVLLGQEGWRVNHKRVEWIWRREGLKVPRRQPRRGRLWLADGSCIRLWPTHKDHVWSYDFIHDRTRDGRGVRILTVLDEYTRECLALKAARNLKADEVLETLDELFVCRGVPKHICSDNGSEFTAEVVRALLGTLQVRSLYIEPGSPGRTGMRRASTVGFATSCSTGRYSTRSGRSRCYWSNGGGSTTRSGHIADSGIDRQPRKRGHGRQGGQ